MDWQPIETAPRDGTPVFLWKNGFRGEHRYTEPGGSLCGKQWYQQSLMHCLWVENPTNWMPLPDPPKGPAV